MDMLFVQRNSWFISRSSSFSVVHVSVDIKIYSEKRLGFVVVFSLISPFPSYFYSFILLLTSIVYTSIWFKITLACRSDPVRVKSGMSLRNGMWHGLRNDIIMQNLVYRKWRKEINLTGKHLLRLFVAPIWGSTPILDKSSITSFQNKLKRFFTHVSFPMKRSEGTKPFQV